MGAIVSQRCNSLVEETRNFYNEEDISLAVPVLGKESNVVDFMFRTHNDNKQFELSQLSFRKICSILIFFPEIDLSISYQNFQFSNFISWFSDSDAVAADTFRVGGNNKKFYAFPFFSLLGEVKLLAVCLSGRPSDITRFCQNLLKL